ncbi:MAG: hypothetical protein UY49_C0022G0002 [Microgenomates group bacterium GW2011_GWC1_49_7]|nr:MAG: hypothetical protein UY49_C0022G0002 [Microgenomates group bacterium GW2011_GWC1_49_7]
MFPSKEFQGYVSPDIQLAWTKNYFVDPIIREARQTAHRENLLAFALNRLPMETLNLYGLRHDANAFYLRKQLGIPEGLWVNVQVRLPDVERQWKEHGEAKVDMYPIIQTTTTDMRTDDKMYQVVYLPWTIMFSGDLFILPKNRSNGNFAFIKHTAELLIQGKNASILAGEILGRLDYIRMLLYLTQDVTNQDIRAELAGLREESLKSFEQKLAGKRFIIPTRNGLLRESYTRDGRIFT